MKVLAVNILLLFLILSSISKLDIPAFKKLQSVARSNEEALDVSYCDLVKDPIKYHGKLVRTSAVYWAFMDSYTLYGLECNKKDYRVNPRLVCNTDNECIRLQEQLSLVSPNDILRARLNVKVIGVFYGPGDADKRYGIGGNFHFELAIKKIEEVKIAKPNTPGPK